MSTLLSALVVCPNTLHLAVSSPPPYRVACKIYPVPIESPLPMPPFLPLNRPHSAPCGREFVSSPNFHAYRSHGGAAMSCVEEGRTTHDQAEDLCGQSSGHSRRKSAPDTATSWAAWLSLTP